MIKENTGNQTLLAMLIGMIMLLMVAITALFWRMNQLQSEVLAALAPLQGNVANEEEGLAAGAQAPDFTLPDANGVMVSLSDYAGKRILLGFSSVTCPACKNMYPHLKKYSERDHDLQILLLSRGTQSENQALIAEQGFDFPVLQLQDEDALIFDYKVPGTPFFYVIDENGVIRNAGVANVVSHLETLVRDAE